MKIYEFGTAPQARRDGFGKLVETVISKDEVLLANHANDDAVYVRGPAVQSRPGYHEFARFENLERWMAAQNAMPMIFRLDTSANPLGWTFVELSADGQLFSKRLTRDMVTFDTKRKDVRINVHDIVLFYNADTARRLLAIKGTTIFELREYDRVAVARQKHQKLIQEGVIASL